MNSGQQATPYQEAVTRTDITRNIGNFIPEVLEESQLTLDETLQPKDGSGASSFVQRILSQVLLRYSVISLYFRTPFPHNDAYHWTRLKPRNGWLTAL
jgi:hypothetical protein